MDNRAYPGRILRAVLSGSFKRDPEGLARAYHELHAAGCQILSPHRIDFVSDEDGFVKTTFEQPYTSAELEQHHVRAIDEADFLWLHIPNGYIGTSAGFELGYALAKGKPVFAVQQPADTSLRPYVKVHASVFDALYTLY